MSASIATERRGLTESVSRGNIVSVSRDRHAARRIQELRIDRGWTPEALSYEISKKLPSYPVSSRTIRRIERVGAIPTVRVMFGIAQVFGLQPSDLWRVRERMAA